MNTTPCINAAPPEHPFQTIIASQIAAGDLYERSQGVVRVTETSVTEDGAVVIYWDGGRTMCEANAVLCIQTK